MHSAMSQRPYARGAALRRPLQPTLPGPSPRVPAVSSIPGLLPVSTAPVPLVTRDPLCLDLPTAARPQPPPARTAGLREETKVSPRRPRLAPAPARAAEVSEPGAAPALKTLRTCPGSQDAVTRAPRGRSAGAGAADRCPRFCRPSRGRGRRWLCLYLVPILARRRCPNARTYTRVAGRCRRLPLLSLPLPSSCWPETHLASRSIPRAAANSPPGQTLRSCRRRPRHLRADTRGWRVCFPPPHCCPPPCTVPRARCLQLLEVLILKKRVKSHSVHTSALL